MEPGTCAQALPKVTDIPRNVNWKIFLKFRGRPFVTGKGEELLMRKIRINVKYYQSRF
jgi:hypothetical protein